MEGNTLEQLVFEDYFNDPSADNLALMISCSCNLRVCERQQKLNSDNGILLSGCQKNETSADVGPEDGDGKPCGAFIHSLQKVLAKYPGVISNKDLVAKVRQLLRMQGFEQHPCLYCSDANAEALFLFENTYDVVFVIVHLLMIMKEQKPSSPSMNKSEEIGVVVVHEAKCKVYIKNIKCHEYTCEAIEILDVTCLHCDH